MDDQFFDQPLRKKSASSPKCETLSDKVALFFNYEAAGVEVLP